MGWALGCGGLGACAVGSVSAAAARSPRAGPVSRCGHRRPYRSSPLAQQALAAHRQRGLSYGRGLPVANSWSAFSVERRELTRQRRRDDRSVLCNFNGQDRPKLCVGSGPRECWCARVRPEIAD